MDIFDYYYIYTCLKKLVTYKKITKNVASKVLKKYEEECKESKMDVNVTLYGAGYGTWPGKRRMWW